MHREDAHGHFFPLTDWRFVSPVSYWDPAHLGALGAAIEWVLLAAVSVVTWRRAETGRARWLLPVLCVLQLGLVAAYATGRFGE